MPKRPKESIWQFILIQLDFQESTFYLGGFFYQRKLGKTFPLKDVYFLKTFKSNIFLVNRHKLSVNLTSNVSIECKDFSILKLIP